MEAKGGSMSTLAGILGSIGLFSFIIAVAAFGDHHEDNKVFSPWFKGGAITATVCFALAWLCLEFPSFDQLLAGLVN